MKQLRTPKHRQYNSLGLRNRPGAMSHVAANSAGSLGLPSVLRTPYRARALHRVLVFSCIFKYFLETLVFKVDYTV